MTNIEKGALYEKLLALDSALDEHYYSALEDAQDIKTNYGDYMTTSPIDCNIELKRLQVADYELCCALLTMLLREDHFCNGAFVQRYNNGYVKPILEKMIVLLHQENLGQEYLENKLDKADEEDSVTRCDIPLQKMD